MGGGRLGAFLHPRLRSLGSLRKFLVPHRWRMSRNLTWEAQPELFLLFLFGFAVRLHGSEGRPKYPLWDDRAVQNVVLLSVQEICQVEPSCTLLENEGAHDFPHSLHRAVLGTETEISDDGNFIPHCLLMCPAVILAQLSLVLSEVG